MSFKLLSPTLHRILMDPDPDAAGGGGAGAPAGEAKPPEGGAGGDEGKKPAIDPLTVDIQAAVEKARKQEKDKLYAQINETKKNAKIAEDLASSREVEVKSLKQLLAEAQEKLRKGTEGEDDEKKKSSKKGLDEETLNKAIETAVEATAKTFESTLAEAQKRIAELEKGSADRELAAYREQLISTNQGTIVPELIKGATRDELEQSLITAKQVFARVAQSVNKQIKPNGGDEGAAAPPAPLLTLPPVPNVSGQGAPGAPVAVDVKQLSPADYKKNRPELLKAAAALARKAMAAEG